MRLPQQDSHQAELAVPGESVHPEGSIWGPLDTELVLGRQPKGAIVLVTCSVLHISELRAPNGAGGGHLVLANRASLGLGPTQASKVGSGCGILAGSRVFGLRGSHSKFRVYGIPSHPSGQIVCCSTFSHVWPCVCGLCVFVHT